MNCLHCEEGLDPLDPDNVPVNDGMAFMHRECMLHSVIGSEDCIRRGPHAPGSCLPDDPKLSKREAALAAYRAWMECNQPAGAHVDEAETAPARGYLPLNDTPGYGTLRPALMLDLLAQLTPIRTALLKGRPPELLEFIFFKEFVELRRRMQWN